MKIIFKSKNQLIEKLVLDERLTLNETDAWSVEKNTDQLMNTHAKQLNDELKIFLTTVEAFKAEIEKIDTFSNGINALNDKNAASIPKLTVKTLNLIQAAASKNLNKFLEKLQNYDQNFKQLIASLSQNISKITVGGKTLTSTDINSKIEEFSAVCIELAKAAKDNNNTQQNEILIKINPMLVEFQQILKSLETELNNYNDTFKRFNIWKQDFLVKSGKGMPSTVIGELKQYLKNDNTDNDKYKKIAQNLGRDKIFSSVEAVKEINKNLNSMLTNIKRLTPIKDYSVLAPKLVSLQEPLHNLMIAIINQISTLTTKLQQNDANYKKDIYNSTTTSDDKIEDWDAAFKKVYTLSTDVNAEQYSQKMNTLWNRYFESKKVWGNIDSNRLKTVYKGDAFEKETKEYGFSERNNPFISFIKKLEQKKIAIDKRGYNEIHNLFASGYIKENELRDPENNLPIILCNNLYKKTNAEIDNYIKLYKQISSDKTLSFTNKNLEDKYANNRQDYLTDLFFKPGNVLANSNERVAGVMNSELYPYLDIVTTNKTATGKEAEENKEDLTDDEFIKRFGINNAQDATGLIQVLIDNINGVYNTTEIAKINNLLNADNYAWSREKNNWAKRQLEKISINSNFIKRVVDKLINTYIKKETTK